MNTNKHFIGTGVWLSNIGIVQNTGFPVLVKNDRFHGTPPQMECKNRDTMLINIVSRYFGQGLTARSDASYITCFCAIPWLAPVELTPDRPGRTLMSMDLFEEIVKMRRAGQR